MTAIASYNSTLKVSGTPTIITSELAGSVSGHIYQITDATKRVLDPATAVVVNDDNGVVSPANYRVDYLFGIITFINAYSETAPVDVSGKYLPMLPILKGRTASVKRGFNALDVTTFDEVGEQNLVGGVKQAEGDFEILENVETDLDGGAGTVTFDDLHDSRTAKVLEVGVGAGAKFFRSWVVFPGLDVEDPTKEVVKNKVSWKSASLIATSPASVVSYSVGT